MDNINSVWAVLGTLIVALTSTSAWRFFENRKREKEKKENALTDDCKDRIIKLEALLEKNSIEKEELRKQVLALTKEVAELSVEVQYLKRENEKLMDSIPKIRTHKPIKS